MRKYLLLLLLSTAFLGCSKDEFPHIKLGEIDLTRADMNNSMWGTSINSRVFIFNALGDIIDERLYAGRMIYATTHYYKFVGDNNILHYIRCSFPEVGYSETVMLGDSTIIPGGSYAPWIKTEYFFKATDDSELYFNFDANRQVQSNLPVYIYGSPDKCILYELTPSGFILRAHYPDVYNELPAFQYMMEEYRFLRETDETLLNQLYNAPVCNDDSFSNMYNEYDTAYRAWIDSFRNK